jgi:uncharacterized BrkB/YihY/UPF0761 family membrane protein
MQAVNITAWLFAVGFIVFVVSGIYLFANCTSYAGIFWGCQGTRGFPFTEIFSMTLYIGLASWILGIAIAMVLAPSESYRPKEDSP